MNDHENMRQPNVHQPNVHFVISIHSLLCAVASYCTLWCVLLGTNEARWAA